MKDKSKQLIIGGRQQMHFHAVSNFQKFDLFKD